MSGRRRVTNGVVCPRCGHARETWDMPCPGCPSDAVDHPSHYTSLPSGVECIDVTEHFNFNIGNAIKYLWRADLKGRPIEDLRKTLWYVEREIVRREQAPDTR